MALRTPLLLPGPLGRLITGPLAGTRQLIYTRQGHEHAGRQQAHRLQCDSASPQGTGDHRGLLQASATATKALLSLVKRTGSARTKSTKPWREGRESSAYPGKDLGR